MRLKQITLAGCCLLLGHVGVAGEFGIDSIGLRGGPGASPHNSGFWEYEAFGKVRLPFEFGLGDGWSFRTGLDVSGGVLQRQRIGAFIGQLGPNFTIAKDTFPLALDLGSNPTWISRDRFGTSDLGSHLQFTTYAGIRGHFGKHFGLRYRFQHMSNGGVAQPNPGLNTHMFSVFWRF